MEEKGWLQHIELIFLVILKVSPDFEEICSTSVHLPKDWGCCGFAGDKGLNYPELNQAATNYPSNDLGGVKHGFSTSRTCEIGMMTHSNIDYKSIAYLVRDYLFQPVK